MPAFPPSWIFHSHSSSKFANWSRVTMSFVDFTFESTPSCTFHSAGMACSLYPRHALIVGSMSERHWPCAAPADADVEVAATVVDDEVDRLFELVVQPRRTVPTPSAASEKN